MKKHPELRLSLTGRKGFLLLVLLLAALLIGGTALAADGDDIPLTLEQETTLTFDIDDKSYVFMSFTPSQSGQYLFSCFGTTDSEYGLYDNDLNEITNANKSEYNGVLRITCYLTAGEQYHYYISFIHLTAGSFRVLISRNHFLTNQGDMLWSLDSDGTLTISGSNAMPDYIAGDAPWYTYGNQITSVIIKNGVPNIGSYAFLECSQIKNLTIPSSVTSIGDFSFSSCSSLERISIPSGLTSVGYHAFEDCSSLNNIILPDNITSISGGTFLRCSSLDNISIPSGLTSVGNQAFMNCSSLYTLLFPDSVTSIGDEAFSGCSKLTSLTVPENVDFKGPNVLNGCTKLEDSNGYIVLGHVLAGYTDSVQNIESIPSTVHMIGDYAFYGNTTLNSIVLPEGVTTIGDFAFAFCENLFEISIPAGLTNISPSAFTGCTNLNTGDSEDFLILGNILVSYFGNSASVTIPDGVTEIGISAFDGNNNITSVTFPSSLTGIANYAFRGCSSLKKIIGPSDSSTVTHYHYNRYDGLYAIELPDTVQTCGENSFTGTALGQSIQPNFVIPENYNSELVIEEEAFSGIAATYVFVPASVSRISSGTFAGCTELRFIYFSNPDCIIADNAFTGCDSSLTFICQEEGGASSVHSFADAHHFRFIEDAEEEIDE